MAAENTLDGQKAAFENAVFENGFDSVLRAGWGVPAAWRYKGRDAVSVKINRKQKDMSQNFSHLFFDGLLIQQIIMHDCFELM